MIRMIERRRTLSFLDQPSGRQAARSVCFKWERLCRSSAACWGDQARGITPGHPQRPCIIKSRHNRVQKSSLFRRSQTKNFTDDLYVSCPETRYSEMEVRIYDMECYLTRCVKIDREPILNIVLFRDTVNVIYAANIYVTNATR